MESKMIKNVAIVVLALACALFASFGFGYRSKFVALDQNVKSSVGLMAPIVIIELNEQKVLLNKLVIDGESYAIGKIADNMRGGEVILAADGIEVASVYSAQHAF
jgi:hypothetical protein